jgi:hypothetical protein
MLSIARPYEFDPPVPTKVRLFVPGRAMTVAVA